MCVMEKKHSKMQRDSWELSFFGFDRRNKSPQLWASPSKQGQIPLITPKFKVFPDRLSQLSIGAPARPVSSRCTLGVSKTLADV